MTIIFLTLFLLFSVAVNFGVIIVSMIRGVGNSSANDPSFEEQHIYGSGRAKVVRISLDGIIMRKVSGGGLLGGQIDMIDSLKKQIKAAENDDLVCAIILDVNSPGGAVTPTDELYRALLDFKESRNDRKIVTFVRDMAASGAYWLSVSGDWIIAEPTAIVGSIGVIMQTYNWKELSEKIGITDMTIKSGKNKDILNPFKDVSPEQVAIIQEVINDSFDYFKNVVKMGRNMDEDTLSPLADGRVFTSKTAMSNGLIDEIGYWDDAVEYTKRMLGVKNIKIVSYRRHRGFGSIFSGVNLNGLPGVFQSSTPRLMSVWSPGI